MEETMVARQSSLSQLEKNLLEYAETHDVKFLAEDAVFKNMGTGQVHRGRAEIGDMLHYMYHVAFDAKLEVTNFIATEDKGLLEGFFKGRHVGEFSGIKPEDKEVDVPLAVTYKMKNGLIQEGHIFLLSDVLFQQLGVNPNTAE